ncbi:MAG: (2Fe-2S)-binding protein [Gemmatimonadales bacterium]|jgi:xanthine dehydrogenase YagT iron-sulfur-binding subunit
MSEDSGKRNDTGHGLSRRAFIGRVGAGTIGAAVVGRAAAAEPAALPQIDGRHPLTLVLNGREVGLRVEPRWTLLDVLRDHLEMTGTKLGCGRGECGACTVLIDGVPRYACLTLALEAEGREVTTVEGLMIGEDLGPVQQAFAEEDAFQCGYCTPGQVVAAEGLLRTNPNPTPAEIQEGMSGNLCRCGAYDHIFKAVRRAAELRSSG